MAFFPIALYVVAARGRSSPEESVISLVFPSGKGVAFIGGDICIAFNGGSLEGRVGGELGEDQYRFEGGRGANSIVQAAR